MIRAMMAGEKKFRLIDPITLSIWVTGDIRTEWSEPEEDIQGVIFDHLTYLENAPKQVIAAIRWCIANNVDIFLCDQSEEDIRAICPQIPKNVRSMVVRGLAFDVSIEAKEYTGTPYLSEVAVNDQLDQYLEVKKRA